MKFKFFAAFVLLAMESRAQELFVFTEPASNMATKSMGLRLNNYLMERAGSFPSGYLLIPEIMYGVSKNLMVHADIFFSNQGRDLSVEGGSIYLKYRIYNNDDVQKHFRIALFERGSFNNSEIQEEEINLDGFNTGFETGIIATQLLHRMALSSGLSVVDALNNVNNKLPYSSQNEKAINYSLSFGELILPKTYKDFKQTNLNLMFELLGQVNTGSGKYYLDAAPSVQFIFNSQGRIDLGYRDQLFATLSRAFQSEVFIRLEYNFFNIMSH
jgi:hypothetical protein